MARQTALPHSLAPRLVGREAAAAYLAISTTKFDELVRDGRMPRPKCIDKRRVWDVRLLDAAADALPTEGGEEADDTWDDIDAA